MKPLPESGGKRQFVDTDTGEVISRRQAENKRIIQDGGWDTYNQWQKTTSPSAPETKTSKRWRYFEGAAVRNDAVDSRADARKPDSGIAQAWNEWRETGFDRKDVSPHGALADWLVFIGLRDEDADYDVGDTPGETG